MLDVYSSDRFVLPLPPRHRFPMLKYRRLEELARAAGIVRVEESPAVDDEAILRVHTREYWDRVKGGALDAFEVRRLGFPWSPELVERSRRSVGGTLAAGRRALSVGAAANLAGGTHHGFAGHGEAYCVLNDIAIAARALQAEGLVGRVLVLDCDVHQGNGTAAIFADDPSVFTVSIHGARNFPARKQRSDLDLALPDGTGDEVYLAVLEEALDRTLASEPFDLTFYLAGVDPFAGDRLGCLALSAEGLARRDARVFSALRAEAIPVAVAMGGGYADDVDTIASLHLQTLRAALCGL